jgi:1-phosphofructokinase family hexose kinase
VALGFLGADNAEVFERFFAGLGIEDRCLRLPGATRTGLKVVDPVRGETTDLNFPGLAPTQQDLDALGRSLDKLAAEWCVLAGSLPPGVPADFYAETVRRLRARGVRVGLDTGGEALRRAVAAGPDFIKPNIHELTELAGHTLPDMAAVTAVARELCDGGIGLVVVSRGAEGALFVTARESVQARPPAITVGSTVGAGDAMVAGLVAARMDGLSLAETARRATEYALRALLRGESPERIAEVIGQIRVE